MKMESEQIIKTEEGFELRLRPRPTTTLNFGIPLEVLTSLEKVAVQRDMSVESLVRLYVGQGLRQDLSKKFADQLLERTARVLTRYVHSPEEVSTILREIQAERVGTFETVFA